MAGGLREHSNLLVLLQFVRLGATAQLCKSLSISIACGYSGIYTAEIWKEDKRHVYALQQSRGEPFETTAQRPEISGRKSPLLHEVHLSSATALRM